MNSALIRSKAEAFATNVQTWLGSPRNRITAVSAVATAAVLGVVAPAAYRDYQVYLSYGPGGTPYNVFGWLVVRLLGPLREEVFSTEVYDRSPDKRTWLSEGFPPRREGGRPKIGPHPVPQRQMDQIPAEETKEKLTAAFAALYEQHKRHVKVAPSVHERHTDALFLADGLPATGPAVEMLREIAHIHGTSDYSVHVTLSPQDAKKVILAGYGQRHGFAGSKFLRRYGAPPMRLPSEYVLLYAPRNDAELEIIMSIVRASVGYMTDSRDIK